MISKQTCIAIGLLTGIVLSAPTVMAVGPKLSFNSVRGGVHVVQDIPCGSTADLTTDIAEGLMEITPTIPAKGKGGSIKLDLTRLDLFLTPFAARHECLGISGSIDFREIGVRLARGVTFTAESIGSEGSQYRFVIPKAEVLIFQSVLDNMPVKQPETAYQRPTEDVTGEIDLRRHTVRMQVTLGSALQFRAGCIDKRCAINETLKGTQTAEIYGSIGKSRTR